VQKSDVALESLRATLDLMPCGVVVASTSAEGDIVFVNPEFTAITGYRHEDVPTVAEWLHRAYPDPEYLEFVLGNWKRDVSETGRDVIYRVRCADGADREMLLRAGRLGPQRMLVTLLDVSAIREAERNLEQSEERFRLIANTVDQVFWIHCIRPEVTEYVSPAFEAIWGRPVQVLYDDPRQWAATIEEEDRAAVDRAWSEALDGRAETVDFSYRIRRPDGEVRWIEDRGTAIRDESGRVLKMVGIAKDVTVRRRTEQAARKLERQALDAQKTESLTVLAGGVAHDMNNLLMGVLGNADVALADLPSDSLARVCLEDIKLAAQRAGELSRQLLIYSGRRQLEMTKVDLTEIVGEMVRLLGASVAKGAELRFEAQGTQVAMLGDATQLRQVVMNLVINASDALDEREGVITLRTGVAELDQAALEAMTLGAGRAPGRFAYVEVADTGRGMTEQTRVRLFEPFFTTKFAGRGLGLAAVLGIVRGHEGVIDVQSSPDHGATFRALFPALEGAEEAERAGDATRPRRAAETLPASILVVDDEHLVREMLVRALERAGCRVTTAEDGRVALKRFQEAGAGFDCVILDLMMPGMDGVAAFRELVKLDPGVRVLFMTGYSEVAKHTPHGENVLGVLEKPFTSEQLLAALARK